MAITPNTPNPVREDAYVEELSEKLGIDPQYIPKSPVWRNEEEIKAIAEMFANMSGGSSGGGVLVVHDVDGTLDKTWQEIADAVATTGAAIVYEYGGKVTGASTVIDCSVDLFSNKVYVNVGKEGAYEANSADGYPAYSE